MTDPKALQKLSYGLFIVTANAFGKDNGCITNTVMQVTGQPNRVCLTVSKQNYTHDMLMEHGVFTASVISEKADFELFRRFGFQSGRDTDKFAGFQAVTRTENGTLAVTQGTNAFISGRTFHSIDLGTHTMFLAEITAVQVEERLIDSKGKLNLQQAGLLAYAHGEYFAIGRKCGDFGFSVRKKRR